MTRHERGFRLLARCGDCDGTGRIEVGRRGANDPDVDLYDCETCGETGEAQVDEHEEDEER